MGLKNPKDNPCWRGYHPVGTKTKDGKEVPNCVPINENETSLLDAIKQAYSRDLNGWDRTRKLVAAKIIKDLSNLSTWEEMNQYAISKGREASTNRQWTKSAMLGNLIKILDANQPTKEVDEVEEYCPHCLAEYIMENYNKINEAEYRGRKVSLGKPFLTPGGPKKRSVYVKNAKGNVVKVNFGDPNMRIKKSNPKRRKSYRARHHCQTPGPRWKANYWSCRAW